MIYLDATISSGSMIGLVCVHCGKYAENKPLLQSSAGSCRVMMWDSRLTKSL